MSTAAAMAFMPPGGPEVLLLVGILIALFFLPKKLPELARSMGEATNKWKEGRNDSRKKIEVESERES